MVRAFPIEIKDKKNSFRSDRGRHHKLTNYGKGKLLQTSKRISGKVEYEKCKLQFPLDTIKVLLLNV